MLAPIAAAPPSPLSSSPSSSPDGMDDDQLMLAYAAGDAAAFDVLYRRHEGALYRFVRRLLGPRLAAEVDEVFQDTWLRIVKARASFAPQGASWRTWAFTIAHNLAMDRLRVSGREVPLAPHGDDDAQADGLDVSASLLARGGSLSRNGAAPGAAVHPSAEDEAFWRAAGRRLLACLDELPGDQRAAFLMHQEDGFTVEAMGEALGIPFETVRSRLRYGLKKLRDCMQRYLTVLQERA